MTMGDRVAVMRSGSLQQVDAPTVLYDRPRNLFVAGFIGSPAMNVVEARLEAADGVINARFGSHRLELDQRALGDRSALRGYVGATVLLGIRPESLEDAALVPEAPAGHRLTVVCKLREALGSEVLVHFDVDAPPPLTDDARDLAVDLGVDALEELESRAANAITRCTARLSPDTGAREGQPLELAVDVRRLHFFDPETSLAL
jgi:multiple sugar transport system ATP-binding protein